MTTELDSVIRVMLVDDQELFRVGISKVISSQPDMETVGEAADGLEAIARVLDYQPDVVLMDLRMPRLDGVSATQRIMYQAKLSGAQKPRIIALTTFNRDQAVLDAVQAGASGFLLKSAEPEFLLSAIRTVHSGYAVIAPSTVHELFQHAARTLPAAAPDTSVLRQLSSRECEVFLLAAKALSNTEIAQSLFVSEATVKSHLRAVLTKLDLQNRIQLVAFAYQHRLLGPGGQQIN
ncbi:response regulator [Psychromicrobium lacuslunae]|uniref:LuxR family transcriptional regulator n=1 Tax=Psychromicrobium lacuslunae TaxID=1618207 RepID=A0A0D4BX17_9MICC|nr:response regulator transcription factor [Psychromicrobium lacuslunae]AJT40651.1 LuxR family transcriptional regulator [Psychromicrobium lacuslunae]